MYWGCQAQVFKIVLIYWTWEQRCWSICHAYIGLLSLWFVPLPDSHRPHVMNFSENGVVLWDPRSNAIDVMFTLVFARFFIGCHALAYDFIEFIGHLSFSPMNMAIPWGLFQVGPEVTPSSCPGSRRGAWQMTWRVFTKRGCFSTTLW